MPIQITVGEAVSQPDVTVFIAGPSTPGLDTSQLIEDRLAFWKAQAVPEPLAEIPHDRIGVPQDWLALVSWKIQVGGTSTTPSAPRPPMVQSALSAMFGCTYQILAAQQIPNLDSANLFTSMLPGGTAQWQSATVETPPARWTTASGTAPGSR